MKNQDYKQAKKEKITSLLKSLASLSDNEREVIAKQVVISNPEGRILSPRNQMLIFLQASSEIVNQLTVVAGFKQWNKYNRKVRKGQHGLYIAVPANNKTSDLKDENSINNDDSPEFYIYKSVFDITQTEEL